MEEMLANFQNRPEHHKILIVLGITGALLLLIGLSYIITNPSSKQTQQSPSPTPVSSGSNPQSNNSLNFPTDSVPTSNEYTYVGNHFQITYPTDIYKASGNKNNGEDNILLQHDGSENLGKHSISFQIMPSSKLPLANLVRIFDAFKYPRSIVTADGTQTIKYSGSAASISDTAIVFAKNGFTYKIQLSYHLPQQDVKIEESFDNLMKSFKSF